MDAQATPKPAGSGIRWLAATMTLAGLGLVLALHWMVFFWVPTEAFQGVVQRIFYVHVPAAWVAFLAFGIVALCSAVYLWLGDERLDMAALAAAEGGMIFTTVVLLTGPLWGKIAWGTYWTWEPRLTLTLLLWFIYLGYFMVRASTENPEKGKRFAAVVGIVGALDIPLIHLSVTWFRSLHPQPVVLKPEGPTLHPDMLMTLMVGLLAFTVLFLGLMSFRYGLERAQATVAVRERRREASGGAPGWSTALVVLAGALAVPAAAAAQVGSDLGQQTMGRAYWHVFIAYALAWLLVGGWVVSIARRLSRVEKRLDQG